MVGRFTAFILILTLLSANFSRLFIFAGFEMNQKYIAAALCENKSKPQLHCNGKCYLMKKIKLAESKEKNQERQSQKNNFQEALIVKRLNLNVPVRKVPSTLFAEPDCRLYSISSFIFQPPRA